MKLCYLTSAPRHMLASNRFVLADCSLRDTEVVDHSVYDSSEASSDFSVNVVFQRLNDLEAIYFCLEVSFRTAAPPKLFMFVGKCVAMLFIRFSSDYWIPELIVMSKKFEIVLKSTTKCEQINLLDMKMTFNDSAFSIRSEIFCINWKCSYMSESCAILVKLIK